MFRFEVRHESRIESGLLEHGVALRMMWVGRGR